MDMLDFNMRERQRKSTYTVSDNHFPSQVTGVGSLADADNDMINKLAMVQDDHR
jgi:hypothetical protein